MPQALSHSAQVRSSAIINRWISSLVFGSFSTVRTVTDLARGQLPPPHMWGDRGQISRQFGGEDGLQVVLPPRLGMELAGGADRFGDPLADSAAVEALAGPLRSARGAGQVSSPRNQLAHRALATMEKRSSKEPCARRWYRVELVEKQTRWWAGMLTLWECDG